MLSDDQLRSLHTFVNKRAKEREQRAQVVCEIVGHVVLWVASGNVWYY